MPQILTAVVDGPWDGKTLKAFLRGRWLLSSSLLKSLKWRGALTVNGAAAPVDRRLRAGDRVVADVTDDGTLSPHIAPTPLPLDVLYEDEYLLILNKPAGLAVHSSALTEETVTVAGAVAHYLGGTPFHPVNRLDRGVSGVMTVAKCGYMHQRCMAILHTDDFRREYVGLCRGVPEPAEGVIRLPIGRAEGSVLKRQIDPRGQNAASAYRVVSHNGDVALLRLRPLTGRTHQLRLHCAAIGHPLLGDWLYGTEDPALPRRVALHACELWLRHPLTGTMLHLTAPLPPELRRLLPR